MKHFLSRFAYYHRAKKLYSKYERWAIPAFLVGGFLVDVFTFKTLDVPVAFAILVFHLLLIAAVVLFIQVYDAKWIHAEKRFINRLRFISPFLMQFSAGALFSASFIFYSFSGTFSVSWPLIGLLLFLMVANEIFRDYYLRPTVQVAVLYFLLFTLLSLILPFGFQSISPWLFFAAGIASLVFIAGYGVLAFHVHPPLKQMRQRFMVIVVIIFAFMNILYVTNRIPPVPMALNDIGVYHALQRVNGRYELEQEEQPLWAYFIPGKRVHVEPGKSLYIFASIFAPTDLRTPIVHHWQYYDKALGEWVTDARLEYTVSGGRADGFRGFSQKSRLREGTWRVYVETERGQVLGKETFQLQFGEPDGLEKVSK